LLILYQKADDLNCALPSLIQLNKLVCACLSELTPKNDSDDADCCGDDCMKDEKAEAFDSYDG